MSTGTIIVGSGEADRTKRAGKTAGDLAVTSSLAALRDAGLRPADVDCVLTGYSLAETHLDFSGYLAAELGITPSHSGEVSRGGATGASLVMSAATAIAAGACDTALVCWADNRASSSSVDVVAMLAGEFSDYELAYGPLVASHYALVAQRFMHATATTPEQLAAVSVALRDHASRNPHARHRTPITVDDVLGSPMISSPLHQLECALVTDFGGAVVLTRADRAADFANPVELLGYGASSVHDSILGAPHLLDDPGLGVRLAGERAYAMAGLGPFDIESAQLYDCFTVTLLIELEALGFCAPGTAGAAVADGLLGPKGALPSNTNGGMLSCANGGILHVTEAVAQLRGTAGATQLPTRPRTALVHGNGGVLSTHATLILGADA